MLVSKGLRGKIGSRTLASVTRSTLRLDPQRQGSVLLSDQPFASNSLATLLADPNVAHYYFAQRAARPTTVGVNRTGRYVRVQLTGNGALAIAEVMVQGGPLAACTAPTQNTSCNDNNPCTADICHRGRCEHECRIGVGLGACQGADTRQNDRGTCECRSSAWPFS